MGLPASSSERGVNSCVFLKSCCGSEADLHQGRHRSTPRAMGGSLPKAADGNPAASRGSEADRSRPGTAAMAGNEDPKAAADALISEGVDKGNEKDFEGAAAKFEEATRSDPTSVKAFLLLGTAKLAVGDLTGAAAACERALELAREPNDKSQAHFVLGAVRRGLGDLTGALESFFAAAQLTQADELRQNDIFFALMEALVDVGQLEQVEAALEKCPKKDSETWALRGRLYAKKYNFEQADKARERPPCGVPFHHEAGP